MNLRKDGINMTRGDLNPDKTFYVIYRKHGGGIFSDVMHVMLSVKTALENNMIPVVDMRLGLSFYNEKKAINGSDNPWEYYFEQPCGYALDEVYKSKNIVLSSGKVGKFADFYFSKKAFPIYKTYLHAKSALIEEIDQFFSTFFTGGKILGVHFRGGDMIRAPEHETPPDPIRMIAKVNEFLEKHPVDRIFLVTEVLEYAYLFKKMFPDKLLLAEEFRGTNTINHYRIMYPRENHRYLLGREAIINTFLLSRANYLIAGGKSMVASGSNISRTAQILNDNKYEAQSYIYSGVNPS